MIVSMLCIFIGLVAGLWCGKVGTNINTKGVVLFALLSLTTGYLSYTRAVPTLADAFVGNEIYGAKVMFGTSVMFGTWALIGVLRRMAEPTQHYDITPD